MRDAGLCMPSDDAPSSSSNEIYRPSRAVTGPVGVSQETDVAELLGGKDDGPAIKKGVTFDVVQQGRVVGCLPAQVNSSSEFSKKSSSARSGQLASKSTDRKSTRDRMPSIDTRVSFEVDENDQGLGYMRYLMLLLPIVAVPCVASTLLWSSIGWGEMCLTWLIDNFFLGIICFGGTSSSLLLLLYLLDFFWPPHLPGQYFVLYDQDSYIGRLIFALALVSLYGALLFGCKFYSSLPLIATIGLGPALVLLTRIMMRRNQPWSRLRKDKVARLRATTRLALLRMVSGYDRESRAYYAAAMTAFMLIGLGNILVWFVWILGADVKGFDQFGMEDEKRFTRAVASLAGGLSYIVFGSMMYLRVYLAKTYEFTHQLKFDLIFGNPSMNSKFARESVVRKHLESAGCLDAVSQMPVMQQTRFCEEHERAIHQLFNTVRLIGCVLFSFLGFVYVTFEILAQKSYIGQMCLGFAGIFIVSFTVFVIVSFRRIINTLQDWLADVPLWQMIVSFSQNNWFIAGAVCMIIPVMPTLLLASSVNMMVRKCRGLAHIRHSKRSQGEFFPQPYLKTSPSSPAYCEDIIVGGHPAGGKGSSDPIEVHDKGRGSSDPIEVHDNVPPDSCLTLRVHDLLMMATTWDWLSILTRVYILSFVMMSVTLSERPLNVFLAWLKQMLQDLSVGVVIVSVVVSGLICFLLPPVPGVPVYLFSGVVVTQSVEQSVKNKLPKDSDVGFWLGAGCAVIVGFILKLLACAMQQKLIGERLGHSLWIKQTVGVQKPVIRAIEAVLSVDGFSWGKVAILCGGPDWPTSVLAGLLKLPLFQMLLGTTPILIFIVPCCLTGAFMIRGDKPINARIGDLMVASVLLVSMLMWGIAGWAIQGKLNDNRWELTKPLEKNIELDWLDYRQERLAQSCAVHFSDVPTPIIAFFVVGAVGEVYVAQVIYWQTTTLFGTFKVTDPLSSLRWFGADAMVKPYGAIALGASLVLLMGYVLLATWCLIKNRDAVKQMDAELKIEEPLWKKKRKEQVEEAAATQQMEEAKTEMARAYSRQSAINRLYDGRNTVRTVYNRPTETPAPLETE